jgi:hypothetical protein
VIVYGVLEGMRKEGVVVYLKALSHHILYLARLRNITLNLVCVIFKPGAS